MSSTYNVYWFSNFTLDALCFNHFILTVTNEQGTTQNIHDNSIILKFHCERNSSMSYLRLYLILLCSLLNNNNKLGASLRLGNDNNIRQPILHISNKNDIHNKIQNQRLHKNVNIAVGISRGGSQPIEPNPNYVDYNQFMPPTLDEEEKNHIRRPLNNHNNYYHQNSNYAQSNINRPMFHSQQYKKLKPFSQIVKEFMISLQKSSPTTFYTTISSILIFIIWQLPTIQTQKILLQHFVCSKLNVFKYHHYHTLLTAAISHNSLSHLLVNLYGLCTFGQNVESTLKRNFISLWSYCIVGSILSNLFFILLTPKGSSCIGLSGVTLSLLALDAKLHPSKEIGFVIRFIPIRLPAQYALTALLIWSVVGVVSSSGGRNHDGIAHHVHLGGLLYGMLVYELLRSGWYLKSIKLINRFVYSFKRRYLKLR
jgi:membrane associated rhomboid family serine protease